MPDLPEAADGGDDEFELGGDGEIEEAEDDADAEGQSDPDGEADDGESDEAEEGQARDVDRPAPPRESRYQRARREAREATEEARQLREQIARGQPRQPQQPDPEAIRRQEQQWLEQLRMMDPVDAALAVRDRERQMFSQAFLQLRVEGFDRQDRSEFNAAVSSDPAKARLKDQVEAAITQARQMGNFSLTRMDIFYRMYGEEMANRRTSGRPRQVRQAQGRVRSQTVRPTRGGGEAPRPARSRGDDDEALLRRVTIGDL